MQMILMMFAAAVAVISALAYSRCPKVTVAICVGGTILGASAWVLLLLGPKDYMLRIPAHFTTILHPWILGGVGSLALVVGVGGIIGIFGRLLISRRTIRHS